MFYFILALIIFYFLAKSTSKKTYKKTTKFSLLEAKFIVSLLAKIAKSDGRVNEEEASLLSQILDDLVYKFDGNSNDREILKAVYNKEKENINNAYEVAFRYKKELNLSFLDAVNRVIFFLNMAFIDGDFSHEEKQIISKICDGFGLPPHIKEEIFAKFQNTYQNHSQNTYQNQNVKNPYEVLDLQKGASFDEVKKQYRNLVRKYHPDILMGKGANEEIINAGTKKLKEINEAYEILQKEFKR